MPYKPALFDGSEPLYAPGLSFAKRTASWKAPKRFVASGYLPKTINLNLPGSKDDEHAKARATLCRRHTREMLKWWEAQDQSAMDYGTWAYLIRRYRTDDFSPYASVKANTRAGYDYVLDIWLQAIGHMRIEDMTFEAIEAIRKAMRQKGRSDSHIHRCFNMMRGLASYGAKLAETRMEAREVKFMLSEMRFAQASSRSVHPSREQVDAIVAAADADGSGIWATGILFQFEFMLRAVDVRGHWLKQDGAGGIVRNGRRWQDGLTWEMFDAELTHFEKVISKTRKSMPDPYTFDLASIPYLRARMLRIRPQSAVGPVFVSRTGLPYDQTTWARLWAKYRAEAGVPFECKMMDVRAGAITEARSLGVEDFTLRDAAQHSDISTTSNYVRGRSTAAGNVVTLRQANRNQG